MANVSGLHSSFAEGMSKEDAQKYLDFLENGSKEGLTEAEIRGIGKVDEALALKKVNPEELLELRKQQLGNVGESGRKNNTNVKPYANSRPSFRKGVIEKVWDMGHIPTAKYSKVHEAYMNGKLTTKEFVDWYNDPANYKPELPSNNRSHRYE